MLGTKFTVVSVPATGHMKLAALLWPPAADPELGTGTAPGTAVVTGGDAAKTKPGVAAAAASASAAASPREGPRPLHLLIGAIKARPRTLARRTRPSDPARSLATRPRHPTRWGGRKNRLRQPRCWATGCHQPGSRFCRSEWQPIRRSLQALCLPPRVVEECPTDPATAPLPLGIAASGTRARVPEPTVRWSASAPRQRVGASSVRLSAPCTKERPRQDRSRGRESRKVPGSEVPAADWSTDAPRPAPERGWTVGSLTRPAGRRECGRVQRRGTPGTRLWRRR